MHAIVRDRLENVLRSKDSWTGMEELERHLNACTECQQEVAALREQSRLVQQLRAEAEPAPGFYARVLQRIEERASKSIWAVFIYSPFGKRLAYASFALAVVLCGYMVGMEAEDGHITASLRDSSSEVTADMPVYGNESDRRDAVLVNFVNYEQSGN